MLKIMVACEESGAVRDACNSIPGVRATSCDLLPSATRGPHLQRHIQDVDLAQYDMLIAFPPCTRLCSSGARHWANDPVGCADAIMFFEWFVKAPVKRKAIENPIGVMSTIYRKPNQIIQPWQFGHGETKATCLWLFNLPLLVPTKIVLGRADRMHRMPQSKDRSRLRSQTYPGIARAMADQWARRYA
jgi:hypothetical protein